MHSSQQFNAYHMMQDELSLLEIQALSSMINNMELQWEGEDYTSNAQTMAYR